MKFLDILHNVQKQRNRFLRFVKRMRQSIHCLLHVNKKKIAGHRISILANTCPYISGKKIILRNNISKVGFKFQNITKHAGSGIELQTRPNVTFWVL